MYLIAGLGNPENKYAGTRHNVGFEAAECLRSLTHCTLPRLRFHSEISQGKVGTEACLVVKPLTYMNRSGQAIREIAAFYKIEPSHVIILCDDVSIPFGHLRLRSGGSAGGHNGLRNIIEQLGSADFPRIRIGVGEKPEGWDLADYVLCHMSAQEQKEMGEVVARAAEAAVCVVQEGMQRAMNRFNTPRKKPEVPKQPEKG